MFYTDALAGEVRMLTHSQLNGEDQSVEPTGRVIARSSRPIAVAYDPIQQVLEY